MPRALNKPEAGHSIEALRTLAILSMQTMTNRGDIHEINQALAELETANAGANQEIGDPRDASAEFERDMAPICEAVATAIRTKDLAAFSGLKAMFASMLAEANKEPALADVLQRQIGAALLEGLTAEIAKGTKE